MRRSAVIKRVAAGLAVAGLATGVVFKIAPQPFPPAHAAPTNVSLPTIAGSALQGAALNGHHGVWTHAPISYTYQWQDCNASGLSCVNIGTATGPSYTLANTDVGDTIRVIETAKNRVGATAATSGATAVVGSGGAVCSPSPCTSGSLVNQTLTTQPDDGAGTIMTGRQYQIYIPTNLVTNDPTHPVPLVVLYGAGGGLSDFESIAPTDKFILVDFGDGNPGFGAYWIKGGLPTVTTDDICGPSVNQGCDDNPALVESIREVEAANSIDLNQVYSLGASKGGGFTTYSSCNRASSNLFTAFSAMSTAISNWGMVSTSPFSCPSLGNVGSMVPNSWTSTTCGTWNGTTGSPTNANMSIQWVIGSSDGAVLPQGGLNGKHCWNYTVDQNATLEYNPALGCSNTPAATTIGDGTVTVNTYSGCTFGSNETQAIIFPCSCHAYTGGLDGANGIANIATVQWNFVSTEHRTSTGPSAPTGLTATYSAGQVGLSWSAASGATSYNVYRNGTLITNTTGTSFSDTGAVNGLFSSTTYTYYLVALNANYASSTFSAAATAAVP